MDHDQRHYHAKRASEELELATRASTELAQRRHRELAELHSAKASGGVPWISMKRPPCSTAGRSRLSANAA